MITEKITPILALLFSGSTLFAATPSAPSAKETRQIAKDAYIFSYPLVMNYRTMYKLPQRWLVENEMNRYNISSDTKGLKINKDGSLTLYFSHKSPGKDKESNWLPAPNGPCWLVLRAYGPGQEILDKKWKQPAYVPQK